MKTCGIFAASLFGALAAAAPVNKRDIVWVTETAIDVVTVDVTATVWVGADQTEAASTSVPTPNIAFAHQFKTRHSASTSSSVVVPVSSSSVYVVPTTSSSVYVAPTTSSSVYVAPTTSSTSVYVEPTTSSTSAYVAPTTSSTSVYVAPTTTEAPSSTYVASSATTSAAASTSTSSSGSSSGLAAAGTSYTGDLTWYATGLGACGVTNVASDHIVAISKDIFDDAEYFTANRNNNPLCGRKISITGTDGSQYVATVEDRCVGCAIGDVDMTEDFFNLVTANGDGRVHNMSWEWL